ncbi:MAG: hypothetical protein IH628_06660, partial [Proteobacteria bacterium]|nr:hypothetical protein [Pseudomonadota bacterium]
MAISLGNSSSVQGPASALTCTLSHSISAASGNHRVVLVLMTTDITTEPAHAVTFNGVAMYQATARYLNGMKTSLWFIGEEDLPASAGNYDIVGTTSISAYIKLIAADFTGVRQDLWPRTTGATYYGTSVSVAFLNLHPGDLVFYGVANSSSAGTWSNIHADFTQIASLTGGAAHTAVAVYDITPNAL